jgi:hypothetical protein
MVPVLLMLLLSLPCWLHTMWGALFSRALARLLSAAASSVAVIVIFISNIWVFLLGYIKIMVSWVTVLTLFSGI